MIIMRKILLIFMLCVPFFFLNLVAQNNTIFSGGINQGYHHAYISQSTNNGIFGGGVDDGFGRARFTQSINSRIFFGGNGQGYNQGYFSQAINGNIFTGGIDDGSAHVRFAMASNNRIFSGGINQGYDQSYYSQPANNGIFDGGSGEGYDHIRIEGLPDALNPVFPVELLSFDAWPEKNQVHIEWVTASEVNHDYFRVERSQDTKLSEILGIVLGQGGPQRVQAYETIDTEPFAGYSYYRLQSFDKNGAMELSAWVEVFFEEGKNLSLSVFPNPAADLITVKIKGEAQAGLALEVFDLMGRPLGYKQTFSSLSGEIETKLNLAELSVGIYLLRIRDNRNGESITYRIKVFR